MTPYSWECPYCGRATTITKPNYDKDSVRLNTARSRYGHTELTYELATCPNSKCKELNLLVRLVQLDTDNFFNILSKTTLHTFYLLPKGKAKTFPDYIPQEIRNNYTEACLIVNDSPKASAAMSRRCLQGIVRDFWDLPENKRGNLGAEINQIKEKVDTDTWEAIKAVRAVGDIGAHMEKDVNIIIDITQKEAELLIKLIETLLKDWYVDRFKRTTRNNELTSLASNKLKEKQEAKKEKQVPQALDPESSSG